MTTALILAMLSSLCFGVALVTGRVGLRTLDARSGASISIPVATILFALAAPVALDSTGFSIEAILIFAAVGVFFPALVTILTFRSNEHLGPTITGAVSGTAPLFALLAAGLLLGENIPPQAALSCVAIAAGIALLSWKQKSLRADFTRWSLLWPLSGAVLRGFAQAFVKAGLLLWPNPFAASLIGYLVSTATVVGANHLGSRLTLTKRGAVWFALTGVLNGGAVLLMFGALNIAPVSMVAPVVATYPLVTVLISAAVLHDEPVTRHMVAGAGITVAAITYLMVSITVA